MIARTRRISAPESSTMPKPPSSQGSVRAIQGVHDDGTMPYESYESTSAAKRINDSEILR